MIVVENQLRLFYAYLCLAKQAENKSTEVLMVHI